MQEISQKMNFMKEQWDHVYELVSTNDAQWTANLKYSSPSEINEVVRTLHNLVDRIRAPRGFEPNFHLAKSLAMATLPGALSALQNVAAGQWGHLPTFVNGLNQILACFHNLMVFSDKDQVRDTVAELGGRLAQSLALVDTAQTEMKNKADLLERVEGLAQVVEDKSEVTEQLKQKVEEAAREIQTKSEEVDEILDKVKEEKEEIEKLTRQLQNEVTRSGELNNSLVEANAKLEAMRIKCQVLQNTIEQLLPKGASAGLAHSFADKVDSLEGTKRFWKWSFIMSIGGLIGVAYWIFSVIPSGPAELWQRVLERLPFTAPLIWFGWFSAIQYGNVTRVQEDYAFKEATSKAFVGYKDHMEHLSNVSDESSKTALDLLSKRTIEILARSPLRIYRKSEDDVSVWRNVLNSKDGSRNEAEDS